jgi:hypothetical protein
MHSYSGEAGFTPLWWIQGAIFATLTAVGIDKIKTKGPLTWGFILLPRLYLFFFLMSRITMATMYYQYICPRKCFVFKKLKPPSLSIKGHV